MEFDQVHEFQANAVGLALYDKSTEPPKWNKMKTESAECYKEMTSIDLPMNQEGPSFTAETHVEDWMKQTKRFPANQVTAMSKLECRQNTDDIFAVQNKTWKARPKWRNIGLGLKISIEDLDVIIGDNENTGDKFQSMLCKWLQSGNLCRWKIMCNVLREECVGLAQLANQIEQDIQNDKEVSQNDQSPAQLYVGVSIVQEETLETTRDGGFIDNSTLFSSLQTQSVCSNPSTSSDMQVTASSQTQHESETFNSTTPPHNATSQDEITDVPLTRDTSTVVMCAATKLSQDVYDNESPGITSLRLKEGIKLSGYQEELAGPGLEGKNYIFVAPTGTGKTLVAGHIIMHHLNKMLQEGRKGKVAFVTPTRQLTFQQKTQLQEYIPGIRAVEITGANCRPMHPLVHSDEINVIVCTAGKLRRELKVKAVKITDFSLIVADECHHAGRPSNYSDIMEFYIRFKLTEPVSAEPSLSLPQVVGLTASPGAGRGKSNISTVIEHHISLCATMDATAGIVTVGKNTAELERFRNAPKSYLKVKDERDPSDEDT